MSSAGTEVQPEEPPQYFASTTLSDGPDWASELVRCALRRVQIDGMPRLKHPALSRPRFYCVISAEKRELWRSKATAQRGNVLTWDDPISVAAFTVFVYSSLHVQLFAAHMVRHDEILASVDCKLSSLLGGSGTSQLFEVDMNQGSPLRVTLDLVQTVSGVLPESELNPVVDRHHRTGSELVWNEMQSGWRLSSGVAR